MEGRLLAATGMSFLVALNKAMICHFRDFLKNFFFQNEGFLELKSASSCVIDCLFLTLLKNFHLYNKILFRYQERAMH
jgi:hypothetical protein